MAHIEIVIPRRRFVDKRVAKLAGAELVAAYEDLFARVAAALARLGTKDSAQFEQKHPRGFAGRFGHSSGSPTPKPGKEDLKATSVKGKLRELLGSGHPFTKQELMELASIEKESTLTTFLSDVRNPKYAGKEGVLNIVKLSDGRYQVVQGNGTPAPPLPAPVPKAAVKKPEAPVVTTTQQAQRPSTWRPAATAKEAARRAVSEGWLTAAEFGTMTAENANAVMDSVAAHMREFPELKGEAKNWFVGTNSGFKQTVVKVKTERAIEMLKARGITDPEQIAQQLRYQRLLAPRMSTKCWATAWDLSSSASLRGVALNQSKLTASGTKTMQADLALSVASRWHPVGCDTVKSVMDHELGHQLDYMLRLRQKVEVQELFREAMDPDKIGIPIDPSKSAALQRFGRGKTAMGRNVSIYAATNIAEFIAEAWAESVNNPNPRPYAKKVAEIVRSEYERQKPSLKAKA